MSREIPRLMKRVAYPEDSGDCSTILMIVAIVGIVLFLMSKTGRKLKHGLRKGLNRLRRLKSKVKAEIAESVEEPFTLQPAPVVSLTEQTPLQPASPVKAGLDVCHPSCCCDTQWPVPSDAAPSATGDNASVESNTLMLSYDKTPLSCRGCNGRGCLCAKKSEPGVLPRCT